MNYELIVVHISRAFQYWSQRHATGWGECQCSADSSRLWNTAYSWNSISLQILDSDVWKYFMIKFHNFSWYFIKYPPVFRFCNIFFLDSLNIWEKHMQEVKVYVARDIKAEGYAVNAWHLNDRIVNNKEDRSVESTNTP